jgi:hypothetical protein
MVHYSKGTKTAEEVAEENRASGFYRVKTMVMKDGEGPWYIRVLTELDEMTSADTHMFCDTKLKPEQFKGDNWPKAMPAICQNDRMFRVYDENDRPTDVFEDGFGNCYIHNRDRGKVREGKFKKDKSTPDWQTYALAAVREPIPDPVSKRPVGYRDAEDEFKLPDGTIKKIPRLVIVSQKHRNFWSGVEAALFEGGPLGARDIRITRKENDYSFGVSSPDPKLYPGSDAWKRYTEAIELTGFDLDEHILELAGQDWYDRWFVEGAIPKDGYARSEDTEDAAAGTAEQETADKLDPEKVADFAGQLRTARTQAAASA